MLARSRGLMISRALTLRLIALNAALRGTVLETGQSPMEVDCLIFTLVRIRMPLSGVCISEAETIRASHG